LTFEFERPKGANMPRTGKVRKREIKVDSLYKSRLVTRFINRVMERGKKSVAEEVVYRALGTLSEDPKEALALLEKAVKKVMPTQEVRSRRVGGATYQVPMPVRHDRSEALAVRWLLQAARARKGKPMVERLAAELKEAAEGKGEAFKKKETVHRMAEANRAFSHFRW
jgi:small subunit ribosomal protein S7